MPKKTDDTDVTPIADDVSIDVKAFRATAKTLRAYADAKGMTAPNPLLNAAQVLEALAEEGT